MTQAAIAEKESTTKAKAEKAKEQDEREQKLNEGKTGVGLRTFLAMTRGKNPVEIQYDAFDESKPDTMPKSQAEFMEASGVTSLKTAAEQEAAVLKYLIAGFNDEAYTLASDPLREYVDLSWPDAAQTQFRLVVRNYSKGASVSLEDAVALIKPGFSKQFSPAEA